MRREPGASQPYDRSTVDDASGQLSRWDTPSPSGALEGGSPDVLGPGLAGRVVGDHAAEYADAVRDTPGVAGYWRLHGAADLSDQTSGGHDGVPVVDDADPAAMFKSAVGGGVWAGSDALELDRGDSDHLTGRIEVGSGWFGQAAWSAEGWVRDAPEASGSVGLFNEFSDTSWRALGESDYTGRQPTADRSPWAPGTYGAGLSAPISPEDWHQVAATDDGSTLTLFVDGLPVRSQDGGVPANFAGAAVEIAASGGCDCWPGTVFVSDISIYSRALTAAEIQDHYRAAGAVLPLSYANLFGGSNPSMFCMSCAVGSMAQAVGKPVNAQTGNFYHSFSDIAVAARGPLVGVNRTYNSLADRFESQSGSLPTGDDLAPDRVFGPGWSWNYGAHLVFDPFGPALIGDDGGEDDAGSPGPMVSFVQENGSEVLFSADGSGGWKAPSNVFASLTEHPDGTWSVARAGGDRFDFDAEGYLVRLGDRNGYVTSLSWPESLPGVLVVTDQSGARNLSVHLDGDGLVTQVTDQAGRGVSYGYSDGFLTSVSSLGGGSWSYGYGDAAGFAQMTSMVDPAGGQVTNAYDEDGRVVSQLDAGGSVATTFDYSTPNQTVVTDPAGVVDVQSYQQGYLVTDTVGSGAGASVTSYSYDSWTSGQSRVVDPSGNVSVWTYFRDSGRTESFTDPMGHVAIYDAYDEFGNPGAVTDPAGVKTTFAYDVHGNVLSSSTPWTVKGGSPPQSTAVTALTRGDAAHPDDVTVETAPDGTSTSFEYDPVTGAVLSSTDSANGRTEFRYDPVGNLVATVSAKGTASGANPLAHRSVRVVNAAGETLSALDANAAGMADGFVRADQSGLGTAATGEEWSTVSGAWSIAGNTAVASGAGVIELGSGVNPTVAYRVSMVMPSTAAGTGVGVAFRVQDPSHYFALVVSGGQVRLVKVDGGAPVVVNSADRSVAAGDHVSVVSNDAGMLVYVNGGLLFGVSDTALKGASGVGLYASGSGRIAAGFSAGRLAGQVDTVFDRMGRPALTAGPRSSGWSFVAASTTYDPAGRVRSETVGAGPRTCFDFGPAGRMTKRVDACVSQGGVSTGNVTAYGYDDQGRLASRAAPGKPSEAITYVNGDASASVSAKQVVTRPDHSTVTTSFDPDGRRGTVSFSDGTPAESFSYDPVGRLTGSTKGTVSVSKLLDSLGQPWEVTRAGRSVSYGYLAPGRVGTVTYPGAHMVTRGYDAAGRWVSVEDWNDAVTAYGYDADGNIDSVAAPNGVTTARSFDSAGHMVGVSYETPFFTWPVGLGRGLGGELSSVSEWGSTRVWSYDASARVTSATNPTGVFSYDPASNPTRLTGRRQAFSGSGELCWTASVAGPCDTPPAESTLFGYDDNGQRTSAGSDTFGYDATGAMVNASPGNSSYTYSADGLRVAKTSGGLTTDFTWDDTTSVPQLIADGGNYYLYGPDGLPVERIGADPTVWLSVDGTGSVAASTDVNGALVATRSYDTWGNETGRTGDPVSLGWQSQYQDTETGLYYLRHRYYDPTTAQFLSPDPLFALTGDRYGYAGNDPVNGSDPTGLSLTGSIDYLANQVGAYINVKYGHKDSRGRYVDTGMVNALRHFMGAALLTWTSVQTFGSWGGELFAESVLAGHEFEGMLEAGAVTVRQHSTHYACTENRDRQADQVNNGAGLDFGMSLARRGYDMGDVGTVVRLVERQVDRYYRRRSGLDFGGGMEGANYNRSFS